MIKHFLLFASLILSMQVIAQTGIGTTTPNASAKLDVSSSTLGFLPPRVTLTAANTFSPIVGTSSAATGLLVYNLGSVGLQAGYYYWNGANWATIATASSSGNGVTSSNLVKLYSKAYSAAIADSAISNATGYKFTVPVSGRYLFDFSSSGYLNQATMSITFKVRQGTTDLGTDVFTSANNNVHVVFTGMVEVNLQAGIIYNVFVSSNGTGVTRDAGDYDRVYYKMVAGNLPVTGQSVDYVQASLSANQSLSAVANINFNVSSGAGISLTSGGFNLLANKTYKLEAAIGGASGGYAYYGWVDNSNNLLPGGSIGAVIKAGNDHSDAPQDKAVVYYTPTVDTRVFLRVYNLSGTLTAYAPSLSTNFASTWASIQQVGSSAIVNPWTLSGTNTFNTTGNVGIGTSTPSVPLDVSGAANVSGLLTAGGNSYPTTQGINGNALTTNGSGVASWNSVPPVGVVSAFAGSTAPLGYLLCDGSAVSRTTYASLFNVIGTTYGTGNGSSTFNVPDLRSRTIVGVGQGASLTNRTLASRGGIESKTLSISEIPSHGHTINDPGHRHNITTTNDDFNQSGGNPPGFAADGAGSRTWTNNITSSTTGITINNTGGSSAFEIMNPFLALNYIIKF